MTTHQDINGNESSKRKYGAISILSGMALCLTIGICSIFLKVKDPDTALKAAYALLTAGGGLLGIGVIEHFGKKK